MPYSLDEKQIYHTDHITIIKAVYPIAIINAVNKHYDLALDCDAIEHWHNNMVRIDSGKEVEINGCDCPVTYEITITEL